MKETRLLIRRTSKKIKHIPAPLLRLVVVCMGVVALFFGYQYEHQRAGTLLPSTDNQSVVTFIQSSMQTCYASGSYQCYQSAADTMFGRMPLPQILGILADHEKEPEIFSNCHELTHFLGRLEYEKTKSIPEVFAECTATCFGGCYHGVMEEYFKDTDQIAGQVQESKAAADVQTACGKLEEYTVPRIYWECLHGIGHAMMYITNHDLPKSLRLCDKLATESDRDTCYGGVFMENSSSSTNPDGPKNYLKADDPMYPCDSLATKYLRICYEYQSSYFAELTHYDWQKNAQLCLRVPNEYREGCFNIIGSNLVGFTQDDTLILHTCTEMPSDHFRQTCMVGVINALGGRYVNDLSKMDGFCSLVSQEDKHVCYTTLGTLVSSWTNNHATTEQICGQLGDPQHIEWCKSYSTEPILLNN